MKSMRPPSVAIFFMTYFHRAWGGHGPSAPPPDPLLTSMVCNLASAFASDDRHIRNQSRPPPFTSAPAATAAFTHSKCPLRAHLYRTAIKFGVPDLHSLQTPSGSSMYQSIFPGGMVFLVDQRSQTSDIFTSLSVRSFAKMEENGHSSA